MDNQSIKIRVKRNLHKNLKILQAKKELSSLGATVQYLFGFYRGEMMRRKEKRLIKERLEGQDDEYDDE